MSQERLGSSDRGLTRFIRFGGLVAVLTVGIYAVMHWVLIPSPPPADVPLDEYRTYVAEGADQLILANGLRNLILAFSMFVYIGAYLWTRGGRSFASNPWGLMGLLGGTALMIAGVTSNTLRTTAFLMVVGMSDQPDLFVVLLNFNSVFDRVLQLFTGLMFAGFSIAGAQSTAMPRWLAGMGLLFAVSTLVTTVGIGWVMGDAAAPGYLLMGRTLLALVWFLSIGVLMLRAEVPNVAGEAGSVDA